MLLPQPCAAAQGLAGYCTMVHVPYDFLISCKLVVCATNQNVLINHEPQQACTIWSHDVHTTLQQLRIKPSADWQADKPWSSMILDIVDR